MTVFERVQESLMKVLSVEKSEVKLESRIVEDLKADSLDNVKLMMQLEDDFNIVITEEQAEGLKTVGDAVDFLTPFEVVNGNQNQQTG